MKFKLYWIIALIVSVSSFIIYIATLCPTIYVGDSPELCAAAYTLGIAHPPGYPIWCLMGKLFTLIPIGSIAYRTNLMSAFFSSASVGLIYLFIFKLINRKDNPLTSHIMAVITSLSFAFSYTFWSQAVITEVYSLNTFFVTLILFLLITWQKTQKDKYLYLFAFTYGMSLTNHHTMALFALIYGTYIFVKSPKLRIKKLIIMISLFLAGLSVYLYIPIRARAHPVIWWQSPATVNDLLNHILRHQYGPLNNDIHRLSLFMRQACGYFKGVSMQFSPYLVWLAPIGAVRLYRDHKDWFYVFLFIFLFTGIGFWTLLNVEPSAENQYMIDVFHIPSYLTAAVWIGFGVRYLIEKIGRLSITILRLSLSCTFLFLPVLPLWSNYYKNDLSQNWALYEYGLNMLKTMDKDAILFVKGDAPVFSMVYLTMVENLRTDVTVYDREANLFKDIYHFPRKSEEEDIRLRHTTEYQLITSNSRPVYYTEMPDMGYFPEYKLIRQGILFKIERKTSPGPEDKDYATLYHENSLNNEHIYEDYLCSELTARYHYHLAVYYHLQVRDDKAAQNEYEKASNAAGDFGLIHNKLANTFHTDGCLDWAIREYLLAIKFNERDIDSHYNLASCYQKLGRIEEAMEEHRKVVQLDPDNAVAYHNLGVYYARKKIFEEAIRCLKKAVSLKPDYWDARNNLGMAYSKTGQEMEAIQQWQISLQIQSENNPAKELLANY